MVDLRPATIANYVPQPNDPKLFLLPPDCLRVWSVEGRATTSALWQGWEPRWEVGTTEADGSTRLILRILAGLLGRYRCVGSGRPVWLGLGRRAQRRRNHPEPPVRRRWPAGRHGDDGGLTGVDIAYVRRCDWISVTVCKMVRLSFVRSGSCHLHRFIRSLGDGSNPRPVANGERGVTYFGVVRETKTS
jgi:hypothetical protein